METINCQNCKNDFTIEPDDFSFYKKMEVPAPTFCPDCRFQRRTMFRNERCLYRRECGLCKKSTVSTFAPEKPYTIYCPACWFSDKWDALDYGLEYDPTRPFFEQLQELLLRTPQLARVCDYATIVNSDFSNHIGSAKNCMLVFNSDFCENVSYASLIVHSNDSMDCYACDSVSLCYEITDAEASSRCFFGKGIVSCVDTIFSRDCRGSVNCFACCNVRNKNYCAFNKQYTKEEYEEIIASYNLDTYQGVLRVKVDSESFFLTLPRRNVYGQKNTNVIGNYVYHSKNAKYCWSGQYYEDCAYCQFSTLPTTKDSYDITEWGNNIESCVDTITVGEGASHVNYCFSVWATVRNVQYSVMCTGAVSDCLGCNSLRKKQYCILNKQYTKEEYLALQSQIIKDMNDHPYVDKKGRVWNYGEFMPYDLSFYDYNESFAIQHFPLNKQEAESSGFSWRDIPTSTHEVTIQWQDLPESIKDVTDSILNETIGCQECGMAFKILSEELSLLRRFSLPLPRMCHNCRHLKRIAQVGSPKLYDRTCDKCGIDIKTSYAPNRLDVIYCESCYQKEVI